MDFNEAQIKAIRHKDGPMMVLAGPGSGKTTVLTERLKYLTREAGVEGGNILVITFTSAAAKEMEKRYVKKSGDNTGEITFGTFHSVFFKILSRASNYSVKSIAMDGKRKEVIKELLSRSGEKLKYTEELCEGLLSEISFVKNAGGTPAKRPAESIKSCDKEDFIRIYESYNKRLSDEGLLDFDDMLLKCRDLFLKKPELLKYWRNIFKYILVDEFQDINEIQYEIVKMLAAPLNNLFIVGDDDQSIYRFRGAEPEIMLNFPNDYKKHERVLLASNYRSSSNIVESSLKLISHNKKRFKKKLTAYRGRGAEVRIRGFENQKAEIEKIISELKMYETAGIAGGNICILYRTNSVPQKLLAELVKEKLEFSVKDRVPDIFETAQARDILSYMNLAETLALFKNGVAKTGFREDFLRIMNKPVRYISREAVFRADGRDIKSFFNSLYRYYREKSDVAESIKHLVSELNYISDLSPERAIFFINKKIGYEELQISSGAKSEDLEALKTIEESAKGIRDYRDFKAYIARYKEKIGKEGKKASAENKNSVNFMTFHASKGLEFDIVYIIDAAEGITPYKKARSDKDMEEERRMFYVAMTRAKNRLHIFYTNNLYNKPCKKSRFIEEIKGERGILPWKSLKF